MFPEIAKVADELAVIRSLTTKVSEHAQGNYFLHTSQGSDGHDHNPYGFSVWLAGGGIKGGTAYGGTDDLGCHAVERPCSRTSWRNEVLQN